MTANATLIAALQELSFTDFYAVQFQFPTGNANILSGSGTLSFNVDGVSTTFDGEHPLYGTLDTLGTAGDSFAAKTPHLQIRLLMPTTEARGALTTKEFEGSPVRLWRGVINQTSGLTTGEPNILFSGELNQVEIDVGNDLKVPVNIDCASDLERFFRGSEAARLSSQWLKNLYGPSATAFDHVHSAMVEKFWGEKHINAATTGTGGGGVSNTPPLGGSLSGGIIGVAAWAAINAQNR